MDFKEQLNNDLNIFFNPKEFGEVHVINKRKINIVIDNEELKGRIQKEYDGVIQADLLYYVKKDDINRVVAGEVQNIDGNFYTVIDVKEDSGSYEVILQAGKSR